MKEQLKKADLFGLAIIAATLIVYSSRNVWSIPMTVAAIVGGLLVIVSIAVKLPEIRAGLGRRSSKYGINSATSVVLCWEFLDSSITSARSISNASI